MGMDTGSGSGGVRSDINVTPLVDVVLVLLIIFMVVTPMLQKGKTVDLPKARNVASRKAKGLGHAPPEPLVLAATKEGQYFIDKTEAPKDPAAIARLVEEARRKEPGRPVLVKADKTATFGTVRTLLKALEEAGIGGASLAAAELKDEAEKAGDKTPAPPATPEGG
ncbi:MAG: biopolymer transporter ExbD [Deltaproteobacteria bacterium]|nr:MAG: biopolymer transporter ExbD [Deltaproteobacteria bacterium]